MFSQCCCTPAEAYEFEAKEFRLEFPNPGYARFTGSSSSHYTGWVRTFYLTKRSETRDADGHYSWGQEDIDIDDGSNNLTGYTDPGMGSPSGSPTITYDGYLHVNVTYPNGFTQDTYLSNPYDLGDLVDTWQARLDALLDTTAMKDPIDFTFQVSNGGSDVTRTWEWPSLIAGSSTKFSTIVIRPSSGYPWGGEYYIAIGAASTEDGSYPGRWSNIYEIPYATNCNSYTGAGGTTYDSGIGKFRLNRPVRMSVTKSIYSFPSGAVCGLSGYDPATNYNFGDMIYGDVDLDTGIITDTAAELQLARGIYGFDITQVYAYSGSIISRTGSFPAYGSIRPRAELPSPRTDWNQYADWCPP